MVSFIRGLSLFTHHQRRNTSRTSSLEMNQNAINVLFMVSTLGKDCAPILQWFVVSWSCKQGARLRKRNGALGAACQIERRLSPTLPFPCWYCAGAAKQRHCCTAHQPRLQLYLRVPQKCINFGRLEHDCKNVNASLTDRTQGKRNAHLH